MYPFQKHGNLGTHGIVSEGAYSALPNWECHADPELQLGQQPKRTRIRKRVRDYLRQFDNLVAAWESVCQRLTEARRFADELSAQVALVSPRDN